MENVKRQVLASTEEGNMKPHFTTNCVLIRNHFEINGYRNFKNVY